MKQSLRELARRAEGSEKLILKLAREGYAFTDLSWTAVRDGRTYQDVGFCHTGTDRVNARANEQEWKNITKKFIDSRILECAAVAAKRLSRITKK